MRQLLYKVGCDGYYTVCRTWESAQKQKAQNPRYTITEFFETVEEKKPEMSPIRKAMLEQFGYVSASLRDKVVLN